MELEKDIREAVIKYSDMLYKICIVILCNEQDVQDAIQDTFCRYSGNYRRCGKSKAATGKKTNSQKVLLHRWIMRRI